MSIKDSIPAYNPVTSCGKLAMQGSVPQVKMLRGSVSVIRLAREIWMFYLHACLCTTFMPGTRRGQKGASDPLETGVTDHYKSPCGTKPRSSGKAASALNR